MASLLHATSMKLAISKMNMVLNRTVNYLKPKQAVIAKEIIINNHDVLAILPTGFGKSLCFELLPFMSQVFHFNRSTLILVLCPLDAIIIDKLTSLGPSALHMTPALVKQLTEGNCDITDIQFVIGHPEEFITDKAIRLFSRPEWQAKHVVVTIDEAHCVLKWGQSFRMSYFRIKNLRSIFPGSTFLALSATLPTKLHNDISVKLGLKNPVIIKSCVDRSNIKVIINKRPPTTGSGHTVEESYNAIFNPLIMELKEKRLLFPKTIVYTKLNWCGYGHELALRPDMDGTPSDIGAFVAQYHQPCTKKMKEAAAKAMSEEDGGIRLLFATEAYSMGVDVSDISRIVHVGPPSSMETYLQEIGRAGRRAGSSATAILYFNASDIAANVSYMSDDVRQFCLSTKCRRDYICKIFGSLRATPYGPTCCDVCEKNHNNHEQ